MPGPERYRVPKALGRAAKAGIRRVVAPTRQEKAREEAARIDKQQAAARAALRKGKKPKPKPKPKTPAQARQERATRAIGLGGLLDAFQGKKKGKK